MDNKVIRAIDRLDEWMRDQGLNDNRVTVQAGLSVGLLGKARKEGDLGTKSIEKILNAFNINDEWLLHGIGGPERTEHTAHNGVPYYDADVALGFVGTFEAAEYIIDYKPFNDCTAYLPLYGDSMSPRFESGDVIAVKRADNFDVILWGEAYLIVTGPGANSLRTVRLLYQHPDAGKVIMRACNPEYAGDVVLDKKDILTLFRVRGKISRDAL